MMFPNGSTLDSPQSRDLAFVKSGRQIVRVDFRDTLYIKGEREYIGMHSRTGRVLVYSRLKEVESLLPDYFIRIHLSYIVNTRHILKFESNHVFIGEVHLPLGDTYREAFMKFLNTFTPFPISQTPRFPG
jgi:two-component system, LytTR family, response regulator